MYTFTYLVTVQLDLLTYLYHPLLIPALSNYLQQQQQQQPDDVTDDGLVLMDTVDNEAVRDLIG